MAGSVFVLLVIFGWMGPWEEFALTVWMAMAMSLAARTGERVAVRVGCGFRPPTAPQAASLSPLWTRALDCCGVDPRCVDLYVRQAKETNAHAVGRHSVAVTSGALADLRAHAVTDEQLIAVLAHELGHLASRSIRYSLVTRWLTAPWRLATRLVIAVVMVSARRQPSWLKASVVAVGMVVAIASGVRDGQWSVVGVLCAIAASVGFCPMFDAALSRRSEFAADRYVVAAGLGAHLAAALDVLGKGPAERSGWHRALLATHPRTARRIAALSRTNVASVPCSPSRSSPVVESNGAGSASFHDGDP